MKAWAQTFRRPHGLCVDATGNLYLVDQMAHVVLKYSPDEELLMTLGTRAKPSDTGYSPQDSTVKRTAGPFHRPFSTRLRFASVIFTDRLTCPASSPGSGD